MRTWSRVFAATLAAVFAATLVAPSFAAATAEQKAQEKEIRDKLAQAGRMILQKKTDEAAALVKAAEQGVAKLAEGAGDQAVNKMVIGLVAAIKLRRGALEKAGLTLEPLPDFTKKPAKTPGTTPPAEGAGGISFSKDIAPIFLARCRNCHVTGMRGEFSMASYAALMKGAKGAAVVSPGMGAGSRIIEVLESGDMPRGGGMLAKADIDKIRTWIDDGAKYDGDDANANLATIAPNPRRDQPRLDVVKATGKETMKFSRDIAPVLVEQCTGCHGGQNPRANLGMDNFARLLNGGDNGRILVPGKPAESLIIAKLKGTADGARMPAGGRPPLETDVIAKFEKWIEEGGAFDGPDPNMPTEFVAKIYAVTQMSHEDLSKERVALAEKNWRMGNPDGAPDRVETKNFLLLGNVGEEQLKQIGDKAEELQEKVATILGAPKGQPLIKGRLSVFVFGRRFDYSEFGQMVEKRSIPSNWRGHWSYSVVDAYACLDPPEFGNEDIEGNLDPLIAEQLAGAWIDTQGTAPKWFTQGSAWVVASRVDPKDSRVRSWDERLPQVLGTMNAPDDHITGKLPSEDASVANYSFAKFLMGQATKYKAVLAALKKGTPFDQAFVTAYRGTPSQAAAAWARQAN